jgi:hypothetical protein
VRPVEVPYDLLVAASDESSARRVDALIEEVRKKPPGEQKRDTSPLSPPPPAPATTRPRTLTPDPSPNQPQPKNTSRPSAPTAWA